MGKLHIVSRNSERFRDRAEAGRLLARELDHLRGQNPVVLAIPRGGIVVGKELATALEGELDVVLAHKLRTPGHPELAMGSIGEDGGVFLDQMIVRQMGVPDHLIEQEKATQLHELSRRSDLIRAVRPKVPLKGTVVIVTDDGVATGATTVAALWAVRHEGPSRLVLAVPVGSEDTIRRLAEEADETLCLRAPLNFMAVGQFYSRFEQVTDQEVLDILKESMAVRGGR